MLAYTKPHVVLHPQKSFQFGMRVREDRNNRNYPYVMQVFEHPHMGEYKPILRPYEPFNYAWIK